MVRRSRYCCSTRPGARATQNTYQVEDLASHGFIVVGIDHTYNSRPVAFPDGRVIWNRDLHDISDFQHTTLRSSKLPSGITKFALRQAMMHWC